jgi:hypothetical protein
VRILTVFAAFAAAATVLQSAAATAAPTPTTTRATAERHILGARRVLGAWRAGLTDPSTGLLRRNTTATCTGADRLPGPMHSLFTCIVRHGSASVEVTYVTLRRNGFELLRHRVLHR